MNLCNCEGNIISDLIKTGAMFPESNILNRHLTNISQNWRSQNML